MKEQNYNITNDVEQQEDDLGLKKHIPYLTYIDECMKELMDKLNDNE